MAKTETEEEKKNREVVEAIATNLTSLAQSVQSLLGGRLKEQAVVILLAHSTRMTQTQIRNVLDAIKNLGDFTK